MAGGSTRRRRFVALAVAWLVVVGATAGWLVASGRVPRRAVGSTGLPVSVTAKPAPPRPQRYLQAVYAVPADALPISGQPEAIAHEIEVVAYWFRAQLDGRQPRFAPEGRAAEVKVVTLPWPTVDLNSFEGTVEAVPWIEQELGLPGEAVPVVYLETFTASQVCAWTHVLPVRTGATLRADADHIVIPLRSCGNRPERGAAWPDGGTYVLAHEATHALGGKLSPSAPRGSAGHTTDDPRDVIYESPDSAPDWDHLMIDPGHDDYYRHGRRDLIDIAYSDLLSGLQP